MHTTPPARNRDKHGGHPEGTPWLEDHGPKLRCWDSLVAQWLRLRASNTGGLGSIPSQETKIPRAAIDPKDAMCAAKGRCSRVNQAKAKPHELPTSRRARPEHRSQPPHLSPQPGTGSPIQADIPSDAPSPFILSPPHDSGITEWPLFGGNRHSAKSLQKGLKIRRLYNMTPTGQRLPSGGVYPVEGLMQCEK